MQDSRDRLGLLAPLLLLDLLLVAHLPVLKRVVDVKRGILRAGSVLDHSWVLRAKM
jgi:hypothetical protein